MGGNLRNVNWKALSVMEMSQALHTLGHRKQHQTLKQQQQPREAFTDAIHAGMSV